MGQAGDRRHGATTSPPCSTCSIPAGALACRRSPLLVTGPRCRISASTTPLTAAQHKQDSSAQVSSTHPLSHQGAPVNDLNVILVHMPCSVHCAIWTRRIHISCHHSVSLKPAQLSVPQPAGCCSQSRSNTWNRVRGCALRRPVTAVPFPLEATEEVPEVARGCEAQPTG